MKILGLRIEKFMDVAEYDTPNIFENTRYYIYARGEHNEIYEIKLYENFEMCYSGWITASWGNVEYSIINKFPSFTHKPIDDYFIPDLLDQLKNNPHEIRNPIFAVSHDGGDKYYPSGYVSVELDLFEESIRHKDKRPVWIFYGESNLGKSFLASKIEKSEDHLMVYETDVCDELPDILTEDIIVVGNKYPFTQQDIVDSIADNTEIIFVFFDNRTIVKEEKIEPKKSVGHILWYNPIFGIGTLEDDETGEKFNLVYKHILTVDKSLDEGDKVYYTKGSKLHDSESSAYAEDITLIL